jgi:serine/threonine-protein kinase
MDDAARFARLQTLFLDAAERPPDERAAFLDALTGDDAALRDDLRAMLDADAPDGHDADGDLFDQASHGGLAALFLEAGDADLDAGRTVGPYRIEARLGEGGMGVVYRATRPDVGKQVALKLVRSPLVRPEARRRFAREQRLLARLQHPNIAQLLDAGVAPAGDGLHGETPYFAMEYVEGEPLTAFCDARRLSVDDRLRLFVQVGEAVQHAHRHLIVHRDLKPSNILVADADPSAGSGSGARLPYRVKLLDFGIAKLLAGAEAEDDDRMPLTRSGAQVMTPAYAAPEQVTQGAVTTATDVYALGVLLYELLTGRRPHELDVPVTYETLQAIVTETPARPSAAEVPDAAAQARDATATGLRRRLRGDLDVIVLKALRKEPARRYASVEALVEDVRRHLAGEPVEARGDATGYRLRKFVQRNRERVAVAAVAAVVLVGLLAGFGLRERALRAEAEAARAAAETARDEAETALAEAEAVNDFVVDLIGRAQPADVTETDLTVADMLDEARTMVASDLADQPRVAAAVHGTLAGMHDAMGRFERALDEARTAHGLLREHLGPNHLRTLARQRAVAQHHHRLRQSDEARRLLRDGLERLAPSDGTAPTPERQRERAEHQLSLSEISIDQSRFEEARSSAEMALRLARQPPIDTLLLARGLHLLGRIELGLDALPAAASRQREALALLDASGRSQTRLAATLANSLAIVHNRQGEAEAAVPMFRRALDVYTALHGEASKYVIAVMTNFAQTLSRSGRYDEASRVAARAVALHRETFGDAAVRTGMALGIYGRVLRRAERLDEAEAAFDEALVTLRNALGDEHIYVATIRADRALIASSRGRYPEAAASLRRARRAFAATLGPKHAHTLLMGAYYARALIGMGRYDEAEATLKTLHDTLVAEGLTSGNTMSVTRTAFARLYDAWGKPAEAARWRDDGATDGDAADGDAAEDGQAKRTPESVTTST